MGKLIEIPRSHDPFERLNAEQRAAVLHGAGPLLVVAGAGTGKTRVIIERIRHLLDADADLAGEQIVGLTFTDKAAAEMKERVVRTVGERGAGVWMGTFHAFCQSVLEQLRPELVVLDEIDHWILLRRNMPLLALRHYKRLAEPGRFLSDFVKFFSRCQDELVTPDDYEHYAKSLRERLSREPDGLDAEARAEREAEAARQEEVARAYRSSEQLIRERKLFPFGALLMHAVQELRSNAELLAWLRSKHRYILVDEFQDTNIAQIELLWLLAGPEASGRRNILAVGDDDQAIYRFRGASFGSFKLFAERFLGRAFLPGDPDTPVVKLVRNYRSTRRILRVAGQTIAQNTDRVFQSKQLTADGPEGERVQIVTFAGPEEEAHWIAARIAQLHGEEHAWREFAVLYRSHHHRNLLVEALQRSETPFVIKNLTILTNPLVRDVLACLRLVVMPSDDVACARVLAAPAWRLEPADLVRLTERTSKSRGRSLWTVLQEAQSEPGFGGRLKHTAELVLWMESLRARARAESALEILDDVLRTMIAGLEYAGLPAAPDRRALDRFRSFVEDWEKRKSATRRLREFIEYLDFFREAGGQIMLEEESTDDAVQLMTVHAAKGLEFEHVFVMRLIKGAFPVYRRSQVLEFPQELMKEALPEGDFHVQEERRLFYVAITRARRRLTLTTLEGKRSKPSPFVEDVLMEPMIQQRDVQQLAPQVELPPPEPPARRARRRLFDLDELNSRAYSRIAAWAATYHPPVPEPLYLSASAVETYQQCPQKYLLRHLWGVRGGPQAALTFGNVMHTTIREFVLRMKKKHATPFDEVAGIFEREWSAAGFEDAWQEEEYKRTGLEQLQALHESYMAAPPNVLHQERPFELPLDQNVFITGRMDQINVLGGPPGAQQVEIVDYKTGRPREERDAKKNLQLSLYALAARELFELDPMRLTFYNLTTNEPVSVAHDAKQLDQARAAVQHVAANIRAGHFPATPGLHCRWCDYEPICPAHEQLVTIQKAP